MPFQKYPISIFDTNGVVFQVLQLPIDYAGNPTTQDYAPIGQIVVNNVAEIAWVNVRNVGTNTWKQIVTTGSLTGGLDGQVLIGNTATGTPLWNNITAGANITITNGPNSITIAANAGSVTYNYTGIVFADSPYTALATDDIIGADVTGGAITVRLPNAPVTGRAFTIKDIAGLAATNNITVTTVGGAVLVDAAATFVMNTAYESVEVLFNGTKYIII